MNSSSMQSKADSPTATSEPTTHLLTPTTLLYTHPPSSEADPTLPLFAFPPQLHLDRPSTHLFATTDAAGARRHGHALAWLHDGQPHALVLLTMHHAYDDELLYEALCLCHDALVDGRRHAAALAAAAETALPPILDALRALLVSHSPPPPAHLRRSSDFAAHGLCRSLKPPGLLQAYLSVLLEERILLVSREPLLLARACHCLVSCLHPLEFCGACVPYLPEGLHPHLETLLNEAVRSLPPLTHTHSATQPHTHTRTHSL